MSEPQAFFFPPFALPFKMLKFEFDIDFLILWAAVLIAIVAALYIFWDVNYFLRTAFTIGYGRLFEKPVKADGVSTIYGKKFHCTSTIILVTFTQF